jgi:hypothetical protein
MAGRQAARRGRAQSVHPALINGRVRFRRTVGVDSRSILVEILAARPTMMLP